ncbi:MAG TPA: hypothetical protein VKV19_02325 [Ktedonobacteraceae bacterium]|nr:hypothetical protein [Ktedonobacteraceae bacterium]
MSTEFGSTNKGEGAGGKLLMRAWVLPIYSALELVFPPSRVESRELASGSRAPGS